jgi:hypothetical protein
LINWVNLVNLMWWIIVWDWAGIVWSDYKKQLKKAEQWNVEVYWSYIKMQGVSHGSMDMHVYANVVSFSFFSSVELCKASHQAHILHKLGMHHELRWKTSLALLPWSMYILTHTFVTIELTRLLEHLVLCIYMPMFVDAYTICTVLYYYNVTKVKWVNNNSSVVIFVVFWQ